MKIKNVYGRQILDSRGFPTVEAVVVLAGGSTGIASVPSGASTGSREAVELRDGNDQYDGKSVLKAVDNINKIIAPALLDKDPADQMAIDSTMLDLDGTENKSKLGANAILAVSLACAKAAAQMRHQPLYQYISDMTGKKVMLPVPMFNVLNGGKHASGGIDIQEIMLVPSATMNIGDRVRAGSEVFHALGKILKKAGQPTTVGDEGGYAPNGKTTEQCLDLLVEAISQAGYKPGQEIAIAVDVAASELYKDGKYILGSEGKNLSSDQMISWLEELSKKYPIISIEDGLGEDDWEGWQKLNTNLGQKLLIVADDLTTTNPKFLKKAIDSKAANTLLVKPNQIGTLSETIQAAQMAQQAGWRVVISHRSGETEDTTIAHLATGLCAQFIKSGSLSRSERVAKYNELLRISETITV